MQQISASDKVRATLRVKIKTIKITVDPSCTQHSTVAWHVKWTVFEPTPQGAGRRPDRTRSGGSQRCVYHQTKIINNKNQLVVSSGAHNVVAISVRHTKQHQTTTMLST